MLPIATEHEPGSLCLDATGNMLLVSTVTAPMMITPLTMRMTCFARKATMGIPPIRISGHNGAAATFFQEPRGRGSRTEQAAAQLGLEYSLPQTAVLGTE